VAFVAAMALVAAVALVVTVALVVATAAVTARVITGGMFARLVRRRLPVMRLAMSVMFAGTLAAIRIPATRPRLGPTLRLAIVGRPVVAAAVVATVVGLAAVGRSMVGAGGSRHGRNAHKQARCDDASSCRDVNPGSHHVTSPSRPSRTPTTRMARYW
jgi:hypothetical protein